MVYRNKAYVALDYDEDSNYYNLFKAWRDKKEIDFDFYDAHDLNNLRDYSKEETIKRKLKERLDRSQIFILLLGEKTKNKYKYVRWEIDQALQLKLPIIVVNLNGMRIDDNERIPSILDNELFVCINFKSKIIQYAMENWILEDIRLRKNGDSGPYYYMESVYKQLGL